MGENRLRLPWLLAFLIVAALALSCDHSSSTQQFRSSEVAGTPLPLAQGSGVPALPDPFQLYAVKSDGSELKLVATLPTSPKWAWSPSGDRAAVISDGSSGGELRVISFPDGASEASINVSGYIGQAEWSPSGQWLELTHEGADGSSLEVMRPDGSGRQQLLFLHDHPNDQEAAGWTGPDSLLVLQQDDSTKALVEFDLATGASRTIATLPDWIANVALSKDASRLAIVVRAQGAACDVGPAASLWTIDRASGDLREILKDTCGLVSATWSPDGSSIAYSVQVQDTARGVYALDVSTGAIRKLGGSSKGFDEVGPWLPGGEGVLVARSACMRYQFSCLNGDPSPLVLMPEDAGQERVLVDGWPYALSPDGGNVASREGGLKVESIPDGEQHLVMSPDSDWRFDLLSWSPDGQWFSFVRSHSMGNRQFEVNADGSNLKRLGDLADAPSTPPYQDGEVPSPDSSKTAILGQPLGIKDAQTGDTVTVEGTNATQASWSTDGQMLVFSSCSTEFSGSSDIFLVGASGTGFKQLTSGPGNKCAPVLSADGRRVVYVRENGSAEDVNVKVQIVLIDLDTLAERVLVDVTTEGANETNWPVWSLDGKRIAISLEGAGIYVVNADGSGALRAVYQENQYLSIRWLSNDRLYFVSVDNIGD